MSKNNVSIKTYLVTILLCINSCICFAQQNIEANKMDNSKQNLSRWNLNKYVWSHTRFQLSKPAKAIPDFNSIDNWATLEEHNASISPDGKFMAYALNRGEKLNGGKLDSLI